MEKNMTKYFIEHKETHLWWYPEMDKDSPRYQTSFDGSTRWHAGYWYKSMWTNDPNHPKIAYDSFEEAEHAMNFRSTIDVSDDELFVTEHLFVDIDN